MVKSTKVETVQASSLILDFSLYPRHVVSSIHVTGMVTALEAGVPLPPVVADKKSRRVIDGFHRVTAAQRYGGTEVTMGVEWRDYATDADMLLDAIRCNASHGRPFANYDRARCLVLAEEMKIEKDRLAEAMNMTLGRLEGLRLVKTAIGPDTHLTPIKATVMHLAQETLSERQVTGNQRAGGMSAMFYINQVINLVENDLLDADNHGVYDRLAYLARLLETRLSVTAG